MMIDKPVAVVTGAARGLGAAVARELIARGYDVAATDILSNELSALSASSGGAGGRLLAFPGDLSDPVFFQSLIERVVAETGRVDVLINNAIWRELTTMRTISLESWEKTIRIGLTAPAFLSRAAAHDMERRGRGAIVNVSSIMSRQAGGVSPAYVSAKGGLESLSSELSALYGPRGIRVVGARVGAIDAPAGKDYGPSQADLRAYSERMIPLGRWADLEEIARAIAWLASDDASYITGTTVVIDGGWSSQLHPSDLKSRLFPSEF